MSTLERLSTTASPQEDLLEPFSPYGENGPSVELKDLLQPPNQTDTEAVKAYQKTFQERFGHTPVPLDNSVVETLDETDPQPLWGFLNRVDMVITSDPVATAMFAELSLVGFDELRAQGGLQRPFTFGKVDLLALRLAPTPPGHAMDKFPVSLDRVSLSEDNIVTYESGATTVEIDRIEVEVIADRDVPENRTEANPISAMNLEELNYASRFLVFPDIISRPLDAEVKAFFNDVGITQQPNSNTFPTPYGFQNRLEARRAEGKYAPPYVPINIGKEINSGLYNYAIEQGFIPYTAGNLYMFRHDIASAHVVTYLKYGDPLIDMLATYASLESQPKNDNGNQGSGTVRTIDIFTDNIVPLRSQNIPPEEAKGELNVVAFRFNRAGLNNLRDVAVVASAIEHENLGPDDEITADMLFAALERLARIEPTAD